MSRFVEDIMEDRLKDIADHRSAYIVSFDYGSVKVVEIGNDTEPCNDSSNKEKDINGTHK